MQAGGETLQAFVKYTLCTLVFLASWIALNIIFSIALPDTLGDAGWIVALLLAALLCRFVAARLDKAAGAVEAELARPAAE